MTNNKKPTQRRCGTYCTYLELPSFLCTYQFQNIHHRDIHELKRKIPVINPKSKDPRDSESLAEERFYKAVLEEVLGEEDTEKFLKRISEDYPAKNSGEHNVYDFFQQLREGDSSLRRYVGRNKAKSIMELMKFQDKSNIPMYFKLGGPCYYCQPPVTLQQHLKTS